jgi:hypothetical protein
MMVTASMAASLIVLPWLYLTRDVARGWVPAVLSLVILFGVVGALYGIFRLVFYFEIVRHVRGRKFGVFELRP